MRTRKLNTRHAWGRPATYTKVEIQIPTSVREWELFSSVPNCGVAAQAMAKGLNAAIGEVERTVKLNDGYDIVYRKALAAYKKHIDPVENANGRCGATDSEPHGKAVGKLAHAAGILAGLDDWQRLAWDL